MSSVYSDELPRTFPNFNGTLCRRYVVGILRGISDGNMVRRKFVRKFRRNTDDGNIYISQSECRRKFVGIFRRISDDYNGYMFYRNVVKKSSEYSDEPFFFGNSSEMADGIPTTSNFLFSSEIGRKSVTNVRRILIRRNLRRNSACFLVVK